MKAAPEIEPPPAGFTMQRQMKPNQGVLQKHPQT